MALIRKYKEGGVSIIPEGGWKNKFDKDIGQISDYIISDFGNNEENAINNLSKMSNNELKTYLTKKVFSTANDYLNAYNTASDKENWNKIEEAKNLVSTLQNINVDNLSDDEWKAVKAFSGGLNWNFDDFFHKTDEEEKEEEKLKLEQQKKEETLNSYKNLGIQSEDDINVLYNTGFTNFNTGLSENISNILKNKGYNYLQNKEGMTYVLDKEGKPVIKEFGLLTDDSFSPDYGKIYNIKEGFFNTSDYSDEYKSLLPDFEDQGNVRRRLIASEGLEGYDIWGDSKDDFINDNYARDVLGRRDYTQSLRLTKDGQTITAEKQPDGSYLTSLGEIVKPVFSGFGEEIEVIKPDGSVLFEDPKLPNWQKINSKEVLDWKNRLSKIFTPTQYQDSSYSVDNLNRLGNIISDLESKLKSADDNKTTAPSSIKSDSKMIARNIRYYIEQGNKPNATEEQKNMRDKALEYYTRINKIWSKVDSKGQPLIVFKKGGEIQKLQQGDSLADLIKENKQYRINNNSGQTSGITGLRDGVSAKEAIKDPLQWVSAAGIGLSFVPVLGVAGGLLTTIADAAIGARDGWNKKDTNELILNLGFTGAGLLGLGGAGKLATKAARAAHKASKSADVVSTIAKATKTGKRLGKAGEKLSEPVSRLAKLSNKEVKTFNSIIDDLAKGSTKLTENQTKFVKSVKSGEKSLYSGNSTQLASKIGSDIEQAFKLAEVSTSRLGQARQSVSQSTNYVVKNIPKVLKYGFFGNQAVQGTIGAGKIISNVGEQGLVKGLAESDVEDIKGVARTAAMGKIWRRNVLTKRAVADNTTMSSDGSTTVKIGNKTINLESQLNDPTTKTGKLKSTFARSKIKETVGKSKLTEKQFNDLSTTLKNKLNPKDAKDAIEAVKQGGFEALNYSHTPGSTITLNPQPKSLDLKDIKSYNRAARALDSGTTNTAVLKFSKSEGVTSRQVNTKPAVSSTNNNPKPAVKPNSKPTVTKPAVSSTNNNPKPTETKPAETKPVVNKRVNVADKGKIESKRPMSSKSSSTAKKLAKILKSENVKLGTDKKYVKFSSENKAELKKMKYTTSEIKSWIDRVQKGSVVLKQGGILKLQSGNAVYNKQYNNINSYLYPNAKDKKLPYSPISTVNNWQYSNGKYSDQYLNFVNSVDDKFYNDNIADITQYIKSQNGKYIPENASKLKQLMTDGLYGPIHNWALNKSKNNYRPIHLSQYVERPINLPLTLGNRLGLNPTGGVNKPVSEENTFVIDDYKEVEFKPKSRFDQELPLNLIKYGIGEQGNLKSLRNQIAAVGSIPKYSGLENVYIPTSLPNTLRAQELAGESQGLGSRLSRSTSDFNAGAMYRLSANKNAQGIMSEGIYKDVALNAGVKSKQADINSRIDQYNSNIMNKNKDKSAQAMEKMFLAASNHNAMSTFNKQALVDSIQDYLSKLPYKKEAWKYYQESMNPNFEGDVNRYDYLKSDEVFDVFKKSYEQEKQEALKRNDGRYIQIPDFEKSEQFEKYKSILEDHQKTMRMRYDELGRSAQRLNLIRSTILKKGGSLSYDERVALENVKYNNRRLLQYEKEYYKNILRKAELLQKAMIKVFK